MGLFMNPDKCEVRTTTAWNERSDIQVTGLDLCMFHQSANVVAAHDLNSETASVCRRHSTTVHGGATECQLDIPGSLGLCRRRIPLVRGERTATQSIQDRSTIVRHSSPAIEVFDSWRRRCNWVGDATPRRQVAWCHSRSSCNVRCPVSWSNTVGDFYGKMWSSSGRGSFPISICFVCG